MILDVRRTDLRITCNSSLCVLGFAKAEQDSLNACVMATLSVIVAVTCRVV